MTYEPNFAITQWCPPNREYIAAVKEAYQKLKQGEADRLRVEIEAILKKAHLQNPTSTRKRERHSIDWGMTRTE